VPRILCPRPPAEGGIQDSGSLPSASSVRSQRASSRSVFARRLRPRNALVSTGSARCGTAPARSSAPETNNQPVHASSATCTSRSPKRAAQRSTALRRRVYPSAHELTVSKASNVICLRCTSKPATIVSSGPPSSSGTAISRECFALSRGRPCSCHLSPGPSRRGCRRRGQLRLVPSDSVTLGPPRARNAQRAWALARQRLQSVESS
jgi:hypothetical protein